MKKKTQLEMKGTLTEIKNNYRESTVEQMKLRIKSVFWNIRKQKTPHQNSKKKKEFFKNEDSVRILWDNFKHTNIRIMEVLEGEERVQEIKNLFEKIMTENFPNLVKETDIKSREHRESQTR
uniref:Uncharacterized protein n=1 Tax=Myotis myotis TaxID=51298 RepID=A0A7J7XIU6_MYOMY|nr:hypothetical protein mMyoMyo1_011816 [Myotis myotis]